MVPISFGDFQGNTDWSEIFSVFLDVYYGKIQLHNLFEAEAHDHISLWLPNVHVC